MITCPSDRTKDVAQDFCMNTAGLFSHGYSNTAIRLTSSWFPLQNKL